MTRPSSAYTPTYYDALHEGARRSARAVVPYVLDLAHPRTVIDVGCGQGAWLEVFVEHGLEDCIGVDGPWVDRAALRFPTDRFIPFDLETLFELDRRFDLALSLEVAEHLAPGAASTFVASLVGLSDTVLFSAAIPGQGGVQHVNEQWPSYWAERFAQHEYVAVDVLRDPFWEDSEVEWWYAQNMLLFVRRDTLEQDPIPQHRRSGQVLDRVHPHLYISRLTEHESLQNRVVELTGWGETLARREADLQKRVAELTRWGEALEEQVHNLETLQPGTVSLRRVLSALPSLIRFAAMRRTR